MKKISIVGTFIVLLAVGASTLVWAEDDNTEELLALSKAKISLSQAINVALTAVPGQALSAELDDEGAQGAYVVEVVSNNLIYEVSLDSQTGKVIDKKLDTEDDGDDEDKDHRD